MDKFSGHPKLFLSNVKMFLLPPNTTSLTQPMDAGIIQNLKYHYQRSLFVRKRLLSIDAGEDFSVNLLQSLNWLKMAWDQVTADTIANCYCHVSFVDTPTQDETSQPTSSQEEAQPVLLWDRVQEYDLAPDQMSFTTYLAIDDSVAVGADVASVDVEENLDSVLSVDQQDCCHSDTED